MPRERQYYSEIEDHFRQAIGKPLYRASPKEWAQIEEWESAGIPLDVVLRGIDNAFQHQGGKPQTLMYVDYAVMGLCSRLHSGLTRCACGEWYDATRAGWEGGDVKCLKCAGVKV